MPAPSGIVSLTTDFGRADTYVAQLHAVIARLGPPLRLIDVSHEVPPGSLESTLFLTETAWPQFGPGAVHLVVVDPGVGTRRPLIALETPGAWLVGPDTGVLSSGLPAAVRPAASGPIPLPAAIRAVEISQTPVAAASVAATFHGRDIMAPVAAALASGTPLIELGAPLDQIEAAPALESRGNEGRILHVDRFGNAITSFRGRDRERVRLIVTTGWRDDVTIDTVAPTYGDAQPGRPALILGSSGYLEIAWPHGDAAERLGLRPGDSVRLLPPP